MQPEINGCSIAGKIWSFRSFAQCDLDLIWDTLAKLPRCDSKAELIYQIKTARNILIDMERNIKQPGTDYTLKDAE